MSLSVGVSLSVCFCLSVSGGSNIADYFVLDADLGAESRIVSKEVSMFAEKC